MTVYDARAERRRVRPTLRLRLTLVNGILLVGAAALLVVLAWLLVGDALNSSAQLLPGSKVTLADGSQVDARDWQARLTSATERDLLVNGFIAVLAVSMSTRVNAPEATRSAQIWSPCTPGRSRSSTTTSYRVTIAISCPTDPSYATSTARPSRRRPRTIASARLRSSSTTKTRTALTLSFRSRASRPR